MRLPLGFRSAVLADIVYSVSSPMRSTGMRRRSRRRKNSVAMPRQKPARYSRRRRHIIAAQTAQEVAWAHKLRAGDAIHLATAIRRKADYFMSYDEAFPYGTILGQTQSPNPESSGTQPSTTPLAKNRYAVKRDRGVHPNLHTFERVSVSRFR